MELINQKKFIGKEFNITEFKKYNMNDNSIVINSDNKILGFIHDNDNTDTFQGFKILDLGLKEVNGLWIYTI